jgi:HSP20 family protein
MPTERVGDDDDEEEEVNMTVFLDPVFELSRGLNRWSTPGGTAPRSFVPAADVVVRDDDIMVVVDVPGVSGDDLKVELYDDVLRIHGERPFPDGTDEDDRDWQRLERGFGTFERVLRVPEGLDPDRISASMTNGVLTLHLRKPEAPEPKRIEIMDAAGRATLESGSERELVGSPS